MIEDWNKYFKGLIKFINTKDNKPSEIKRMTQKEIEAEIGYTFEQFKKDKTFTKDSPTAFMNMIVASKMSEEYNLDKEDKDKVPPAGFVGGAMNLYLKSFKQYKQYLIKSGFTEVKK